MRFIVITEHIKRIANALESKISEIKWNKQKCVPLVIFNLDDDRVDRKSTAEKKCARAAYYVVCSCQSLTPPFNSSCYTAMRKNHQISLAHFPACSCSTLSRENSDKIPNFWHRADSQVSEFKVMDRSKQIGNVRIAQNKLSYSASRHHLRLWRFINDDGLLNG